MSDFNDKNENSTPEEFLKLMVDWFNQELGVMEECFHYGANFEWFYTTEGKKRLRVKDLAPIEKLPQDKAATKIQEVQKFMEGLDGQLGV